MLKGFRDFILQGNVVELATAVIIGGAFTAIVTAFSDKIINPLIAAVGGAEGPALQIPLKEGVPEATLDIGAVITAAINFLIVAAIVYFIPRKKFLRPPRICSATSAKSCATRPLRLLVLLRVPLPTDRSIRISLRGTDLQPIAQKARSHLRAGLLRISNPSSAGNSWISSCNKICRILEPGRVL